MSEDASIEPIEPSETLYTLEEAKAEMNRQECASYGHDITIGYASKEPVRLDCARCGKMWRLFE